MSPDDQQERTRDDDHLVSVIDSLQREVDGLLESGRLRSIIEQAKGMLAERLGIGPEEAFDQLRSISQTNNARLVDVAATIVGRSARPGDCVGFDESTFPETTKPGSATSSSWRQVRDEPNTRAAASDAVAACLASTVRTGDAAAEMLSELVEIDVDACLLFAVRPDDSLEMIGSWGYPTDMVSAWQLVPLAVDVPLTGSVRENAAKFFSTRKELCASYPAMARVRSPYETLIVLPVTEDGRPTGVVTLSSRSSLALDASARQRLVRQVDKIGPAILRGTRTRDHVDAVVGAVLQVSTSPWMVLGVGPTLAVDSLVVIQVSDQVHRAERLEGRRLLAAIPRLGRDDELVSLLGRLILHGGLLTYDRAALHDVGAPWDGPVGRLKAVRADGRIILMWTADSDE